MKTTIPESILNACESLGWTVSEYEDGTAEISQYSPAGEDFSFSADLDNLPESIRNYYEDFDAEEHAAMWYGGPGAPDLHTLLEDADAIKSMLEDLAIAVTQAAALDTFSAGMTTSSTARNNTGFTHPVENQIYKAN